MAFIFKLLKYPLVRIIGVLVILYFGVYNNKDSQESIGNSWSVKNIKNTVSQAKEKGEFIVFNLKYAATMQNSELVQERKREESAKISIIEAENINALKIEDVKIGEGEAIVKCGDEAEVSYGIYDKNSNKEIEFFESEKFVIGENKQILLEKKIIGMKRGGIRIVNIPMHFKTAIQNIALLLKFNQTDLIYKVTLKNFVASSDDKKCN